LGPHVIRNIVQALAAGGDLEGSLMPVHLFLLVA
jgi:hypothetical protein